MFSTNVHSSFPFPPLVWNMQLINPEKPHLGTNSLCVCMSHAHCHVFNIYWSTNVKEVKRKSGCILFITILTRPGFVVTGQPILIIGATQEDLWAEFVPLSNGSKSGPTINEVSQQMWIPVYYAKLCLMPLWAWLQVCWKLPLIVVGNAISTNCLEHYLFWTQIKC